MNRQVCAQERAIFKRSSNLISASFGGRIQKIPVDAGFSCPNLDGRLSKSGCSYCNNQSFSPFYSNSRLSITEQLRQGVSYFGKRYDCKRFFAYFQSYTCTYASLPVLRARYSEALEFPGIEGLIIATRPDCINTEILQLLKELQQNKFIRLELGIESFDDRVLQLINRCHTSQEAISALRMSVDHGIATCAHLILGLPEEPQDYLPLAARIISESGADMVKLHHLQIVKNSRLAEQFLSAPGRIKLHTLATYLDALCEFIAHLAPHVYIDRLINRVQPDQLLAPKFGIKDEAEFQKLLEQQMINKNLFQGTLFSKKC